MMIIPAREAIDVGISCPTSIAASHSILGLEKVGAIIAMVRNPDGTIVEFVERR